MFREVIKKLTMTVVTHKNPDLDAGLATYLVHRVAEMLTGTRIVLLREYVPAGQRGSWSEEDETCFVVDTGGEYDPRRRLFDHHFAPLAKDTSVSAASLVWHALFSEYGHNETIREWLEAVRELVVLVTDGDHGRAHKLSYTTGLHALVSNIRAKWRGNDDGIMDGMFELFDAITEQLVYQARVAREAKNHIFQLTDSIAFVKDGSSDVTRHALENNVLVLYVNTTLPNTVAVGIQRSNERLDIDVGEVVEVMKRLAAEAGDEDVLHELNKLFVHPSGFGAMRGTGKHPDPTQVDPLTERKLGECLVRAAKELEII